MIYVYEIYFVKVANFRYYVNLYLMYASSRRTYYIEDNTTHCLNNVN